MEAIYPWLWLGIRYLFELNLRNARCIGWSRPPRNQTLEGQLFPRWRLDLIIGCSLRTHQIVNHVWRSDLRSSLALRLWTNGSDSLLIQVWAWFSIQWGLWGFMALSGSKQFLWSGIDNHVWAYCVGIRCIDWRSYYGLLGLLTYPNHRGKDWPFKSDYGTRFSFWLVAINAWS